MTEQATLSHETIESLDERIDIGERLTNGIVDAMKRDPLAKRAYDEALIKGRRGIGQDLRFEFTSSTGVKISAEFYVSNSAVYQDTRISLRELESETPKSFGVTTSEGDFGFSDVSFSAGDLINSYAAETGARQAIRHFFGPQA